MASTTTPTTPGQPGPMGASEYTAGSIPSLVSFGFHKVQPPSAVYIQRDDVLLLRVTSGNVTGKSVNVTVRLLLPMAQQPGQPEYTPPPPAKPVAAAGIPQVLGASAESQWYPGGMGIGPGYIQTIRANIAPPNANSSAKLLLPLAEGYLLSVAAAGDPTGSAIGQLFVTACLARPGLGNDPPIPTEALFSDYVTDLQPSGWPIVLNRQPAYGEAQISAIIPAAPAAGADWSFTVPSQQRYRVHTLAAVLTTAVAIANRDVHIVFQDGGGHTVGVFGSAFNQGAATVRTYSAGRGLAAINDSGTGLLVNFPLPTMDLIAGWSIASNTVNLQAADQWSAIVLGAECMVA